MAQWDKRKVDIERANVAREARKAANRLHARCAIVIAFYMDDEGVHHMVDGGQSPVPTREVYERLLTLIYAEEEQKKKGQQETVLHDPAAVAKLQ